MYSKLVIINLVCLTYKHFVQCFLNHKTHINSTPTNKMAIDLLNEIILKKILT